MGNTFKSEIKNQTSEIVKITFPLGIQKWNDYTILPNEKATTEYEDSIAVFTIVYKTCFATYTLLGNKDLTISEDKNGQTLILSSEGDQKSYVFTGKTWECPGY